MNVLVGVFTGNDPKYKARRDLCERTWVKGLRDLGHRVYFVESTTHPIPDQCIDGAKVVTAPDGWEYLPQKTRAWCEHALQYPLWTHLAKFDDDSFVHPERWDAFTKTLTENDHYIGADVGTYQCFTPYASGGAGYVLSRRAAAIVAEKLTDKVGYEDKRVGEILLAAGIPLRHDPRFIPFGAQMGRPQKDNDLIATHAVPEADWLDSWRQCS